MVCLGVRYAEKYAQKKGAALLRRLHHRKAKPVLSNLTPYNTDFDKQKVGPQLLIFSLWRLGHLARINCLSPGY